MPPRRAGREPRPGPQHRTLTINTIGIKPSSWAEFLSVIKDTKEYEPAAVQRDNHGHLTLKYVGKATDWVPLKKLISVLREKHFSSDPDENSEELQGEQTENIDMKVSST